MPYTHTRTHPSPFIHVDVCVTDRGEAVLQQPLIIPTLIKLRLLSSHTPPAPAAITAQAGRLMRRRGVETADERGRRPVAPADLRNHPALYRTRLC